MKNRLVMEKLGLGLSRKKKGSSTVTSVARNKNETKQQEEARVIVPVSLNKGGRQASSGSLVPPPVPSFPGKLNQNEIENQIENQNEKENIETPTTQSSTLTNIVIPDHVITSLATSPYCFFTGNYCELKVAFVYTPNSSLQNIEAMRATIQFLSSAIYTLIPFLTTKLYSKYEAIICDTLHPIYSM